MVNLEPHLLVARDVTVIKQLPRRSRVTCTPQCSRADTLLNGWHIGYEPTRLQGQNAMSHSHSLSKQVSFASNSKNLEAAMVALDQL